MYEIYNPFEKAFKPDPDTGDKVKVLQALVPTGRHVGHANDLKVVRNKRGGGGRATRLEHYRRGKKRGGE